MQIDEEDLCYKDQIAWSALPAFSLSKRKRTF